MKYVIPILVAALLAYALIRRVNPYEAFIRGAADAVPTLLRVLPALAAMLGAITLLRGCGALDALGNWLSPVFEKIGIPSELTPLILLRPYTVRCGQFCRSCCFGLRRFNGNHILHTGSVLRFRRHLQNPSCPSCRACGLHGGCCFRNTSCSNNVTD